MKLAAIAALTFIAAQPGRTPPWGKGQTTEEKAALDKTAVCTDGKGHLVVVAPHERALRQLFYGEGSQLFEVPLPPWILDGSRFLDPRFFNRTYNDNFRGVDMRIYSQ